MTTTQPKTTLTAAGWNTVAKQIFAPLILAPLLFWLAGTVNWVWGWVFNAVHVLVWVMMTAAVWQQNPDLLNARGRTGKGSKGWDIVLLSLYGLAWLGVVIVGALDARFGWSPLMLVALPVLGVVLTVAGFALTTWGMVVNRYFEVTVRLQDDRNHTVITAGPYQIVRHPGYTGVILAFFVGMPLMLNSWAAFIPAVIGAAIMILRTALEDRTLQQELTGYREYTQQTRWRLVPYLW